MLASKFLAYRIQLLSEVREELESIQEHVTYTGEHGGHKIPHVMIVPPPTLPPFPESMDLISRQPALYKIKLVYTDSRTSHPVLLENLSTGSAGL